MSQRGQMDANLMGSSGFQAEKQFGVLGKPFADFIVRDRGLAAADDRIFETIVRIASDRAVERPARVIWNPLH